MDIYRNEFTSEAFENIEMAPLSIRFSVHLPSHNDLIDKIEIFQREVFECVKLQTFNIKLYGDPLLSQFFFLESIDESEQCMLTSSRLRVVAETSTCKCIRSAIGGAEGFIWIDAVKLIIY